MLPAADLDATLAFFVERLGFSLEAIAPAEDPDTAVIAGHGLRLRLARAAGGAPGHLRLACADVAETRELTAPNGTLVELVAAEPALAVPPLRASFVVSELARATWTAGRAGMRYRDLIPDRQGGRFVASHIRIDAGGPVADYVHFHRVAAQIIYCHRGSVRLVYEDQGPPFVMQAGDCLLQPPGIRHRVLECEPGLEVIEVVSPAAHETGVDHELALPAPVARPGCEFAGQRFVLDRAADAEWLGRDGFEVRDTRIAAASAGAVAVRVLRVAGAQPVRMRHQAELLLRFVLQGAAAIECAAHGAVRLAAGDACVVPAGVEHVVSAGSRDFEMLEVELPAPR